MKAARVQETGGPERIVVEDVPDPVPGPGELLIDVAAAGVNFIDIYLRSGVYPAQLPLTPGAEAAGTVVAVGPDVPAERIGTRVASTEVAGAYAELATVRAERAVDVPDGIPDDIAAAALLQGMTAHYLLHDSYPVQPGDTVLVHAAAGGVGLLLVQMAAALGARVIGTASTPEKADRARAAGAEIVVGYDDAVATVREVTGGIGVAAVYDGVGRATFDAGLASLRRHGVMVSFGNASGTVPAIEPLRLPNSIYLTRPTLGHFVVTRDDLERRATAVFGDIAAGRLDVHIGARYPLAEAGAAQRDLAARATTGKLLIVA